MAFARSIAREVERKKLALTQTLRDATTMAGDAVVDATPVDTGRARGGWRAGRNKMPNAPEDGRVDPNGMFTKTHLSAVAQSMQLGDSVTFANGVPYIHYLETGTVKMAAFAMVASVRVRWPQFVEAARRRHKV